MGLRINTNVQSLVAQNRLAKTRDSLDHTQTKMATGSRIVRPMDDAAGLAISENLRADMRSTQQNIRNAQMGFFMLDTADGALNEISNIVIRMKELAVQAASDTNGDRERSYLDMEYQELKSEIDRISASTTFNGRPLLNAAGETIEIQVGPNNIDEKDRVTVAAGFDVTAASLGVADLELSTNTDARDALDPIQDALTQIARTRGAIGAAESRLNSTVQNLGSYEENITKAFSQIRDADFAVETSNFAKYNILSQAGTSVLTQANTSPQLALKLMQG